MRNQYFFLLGIIIIATFLRFYSLGTNPPALTWDEAAWGYNAYSLGIDGKDEFGRFLPVDYLESFGDFKPPVYAYLDILPVKIFGLTEFAVRFPSAFFGVLTVIITYFLTRRIFFDSKQKEIIALTSAFMLAISPWHINLSRAAFEANIATFFLVSSVWLFLCGIDKKGWYFTLSAVFFALSFYTFNTTRVVAPLLVLILAVGFRNEILKKKKEIYIAGIVGLILVLPTVKFLLTPAASLRFHEVNIFSDPGVVERSNQEIANDNNAWWSKIIHNRRVGYSIEYLRHYFDNLNPSFLFIKGDGNPKFSTQDVGQLYLWEFPFLIAGILFLVKKKEGRWWLIPLWLILGILPAGVARETPHALRIETTLPTFQILVAYGIVNLFSLLRRKQIAIIGLVFIATLNFIYYIHGYYVHYPREFSGEWQYGYKDALTYVKDEQAKYDKVYITESLGRPYIYTLFYTEYNPRQFRKEAVIEREVFGFVHVKQFNKYYFAKDINNLLSNSKKILYINVPNSVPGSAKILKKFYLLNGNESLVAYEL